MHEDDERMINENCTATALLLAARYEVDDAGADHIEAVLRKLTAYAYRLGESRQLSRHEHGSEVEWK